MSSASAGSSSANGVSHCGTHLSNLPGNAPALTHRFQHKLQGCLRSLQIARNKANNVLWPGSLLNLGVSVGGVLAVRMYDFSFTEPIREKITMVEDFIPFGNGSLSMLCACTMCGLVLFLTTVLCRKMMLRCLLNYRIWMYEPPGKRSVFTMVWGSMIKLVTGGSSTLYAHQSVLPRMPVPPLKESMAKLMKSLEPLYAHQPDKLQEFRQEAKQFEETVGPKLQRALVLRSWWEHNFVSDWWEKYVYLMGRSPLPINSNYYIMDQCYWTPTHLQCARAAGVLYQMLHVREQILTQNFEPLVIQSTVPVCMAQYKRIFSTTRVPGEEIDVLKHYPPRKSKHVVVNRRGLLYKLDISDIHGQLLTPSCLEKQMEWIVEDADARYADVPESERLVPVLTSIDRTTWAKTRSEYFSKGVNKETLHWVESAIMHVVLDTKTFPDLSTRAAHLLHGDVGGFWFDKSIELIAMPDGHIGLNCEHSYADAPVIAHVLEYNLTYDVISELYNSKGHCNDPHPLLLPHHLKGKPTPLSWEVDNKLAAVISRACSQADKNITDLDLVLCDHDDFGKGAIKKCKLSPDAFIQMALHTTYRKLTGKPVLTYEASMTRLFKHGRTETVRSLTPEANNFVVKFLDPNSSAEEKKELLKLACNTHVTMYKDAMNGKGLDRHLFALYVASRGLGIDCEFLKKVLSIPWTLSTSQQPQQQIPWSPGCSDPKFHNQLCPGGGFGPVAEDGYGVSYMVPGDLRIFFHVSSRHSCPGTSSQQFMETLKETLAQMISLHDVKTN